MTIKKLNFILLPTLILSMSLGIVSAEEIVETEEEILQEQEFKPIEITGHNQNNEDIEFIEVEKDDNAIKYLNIKNEFYYGMKIVLESDKLDAQIKTKEIYLNGYEKASKVPVSKSANYKVKVYSLNNQYLGSLRTRARQEKNIRVSPFLLIPASYEASLEEPTKAIKVDSISEDATETVKEEAKEGAKEEEIVETVVERSPILNIPQPLKEFKSELKESPKPISGDFKSQELAIEPIKEKEEPSKKEPEMTLDDKIRFIKVANISDSIIHIDILEPNGSPIGSGWTISNDIYVPQFLNFQSQPISIKPSAQLHITESKSKSVISKKAAELNVDEKGNYVWFISSPSELSPNEEKL